MGFEKLRAKAKAKPPTPDISPEQQAKHDREDAAKWREHVKEMAAFHGADTLPTCAVSEFCKTAYDEMLAAQKEALAALELALEAIEKFEDPDFIETELESDNVYWRATSKAFTAIRRKNEAIDRFNRLLMQGGSECPVSC